MSQDVMVIMQGFPTVEAMSFEARFDRDGATRLLQEKLKNGYLKWKALKERESAAKIFAVEDRDKQGVNLLFGPSRQSMKALELMATADYLSIQIKEQRDGLTQIVVNNGGQLPRYEKTAASKHFLVPQGLTNQPMKMFVAGHLGQSTTRETWVNGSVGTLV